MPMQVLWFFRMYPHDSLSQQGLFSFYHSLWFIPSRNNGHIFSVQPSSHEPPPHPLPTKKGERTVVYMEKVQNLTYCIDSFCNEESEMSILVYNILSWLKEQVQLVKSILISCFDFSEYLQSKHLSCYSVE